MPQEVKAMVEMSPKAKYKRWLIVIICLMYNARCFYYEIVEPMCNDCGEPTYEFDEAKAGATVVESVNLEAAGVDQPDSFARDANYFYLVQGVIMSKYDVATGALIETIDLAALAAGVVQAEVLALPVCDVRVNDHDFILHQGVVLFRALFYNCPDGTLNDHRVIEYDFAASRSVATFGPGRLGYNSDAMRVWISRIDANYNYFVTEYSYANLNYSEEQTYSVVSWNINHINSSGVWRYQYNYASPKVDTVYKYSDVNSMSQLYAIDFVYLGRHAFHVIPDGQYIWAAVKRADNNEVQAMKLSPH